MSTMTDRLGRVEQLLDEITADADVEATARTLDEIGALLGARLELVQQRVALAGALKEQYA